MATDSAAPIKVAPLLDVKPWGGRRLTTCGIALPDEAVIGEALLTASEATVISGPAAGATLGELCRAQPEAWVGTNGLAATGGRPMFPLLIKLIDASADLSVQIHPDDVYAAAADLGTGKTEAWHILDAQPESVLYLGLLPGAKVDDFLRACRQADGSAARFLRRVVAAPGMTIVVPAGTLHAIGAGVLIYEIQQPSNVTFRLDDWGRRDAAGRPRDLHHDQGFSVLDPDSRPMPVAPVALDAAPERTLLTATRYFALERMALLSGMSACLPPVESPQAITYLRGTGTLATAAGEMPVAAGETIILPVGSSSALAASEDAAVLRGWVPDFEQDVATHRHHGNCKYFQRFPNE